MGTGECVKKGSSEEVIGGVDIGSGFYEKVDDLEFG